MSNTTDYTAMMRVVRLVDDLGGCCTVREFLRRNGKQYTEKTARNHLDSAAQHNLLVKRRDDNPDRVNVNCIRYELPGYNNREVVLESYNPHDIRNVVPLELESPEVQMEVRKLMRQAKKEYRKNRISVRTVRK